MALHGFTGNGLDFECFAREDSSYSWWVPDLMGHGKSLGIGEKGIGDYTFSAHIDYLDRIADQIGEAFVLLGYSMGGRLALNYAIERPERVKRLILVGVNPGIEDDSERELRRRSDEDLAESIIRDGVRTFLERWQSQPLIRSQRNIVDAVREGMFARRLENSAVGLANSLRGMGLGMMKSLWRRLGEIQCPAELITGELDGQFCEIARRMVMVMPDIVHRIVLNVGHAAIWENIFYLKTLLASKEMLNLAYD